MSQKKWLSECCWSPKILTKIEYCAAKSSHGHKLGCAWSCLVLVGNDKRKWFPDTGSSKSGWEMCWVLVKCGCTVGPAAFSKSLFWDTLYVLVCRHVHNLFSDQLQKLIQNRFAANLRYLELPCDLITREVLQELANRHPSPRPHHWHPNHHHHPHIIHHHRRHIQSTPSKSASCFRHYEAIQLHCKHCQHCHNFVAISIIITQLSK